MRNWKFYHGTSQQAFESIKKNGFLLTPPRFHNFLASHGVYLVPNRPLIARRFAKLTGREDFSCPIVFQVFIKRANSIRTLDLTTDRGMHRFYSAYVKARQMYALRKTPKLGSSTPPELAEYIQSVISANDTVLHKLDEADRARQADPRRFNWDTAAFDLVVAEDKIQLIVAAIREGTTYNLTFFNHEPKYHRIPHYCGIGARDHIEVCVTDLSIINLNKFTERTVSEDLIEFDEDFINWVTNIDSLDAQSGNQ